MENNELIYRGHLAVKSQVAFSFIAVEFQLNSQQENDHLQNTVVEKLRVGGIAVTHRWQSFIV